MGGGAMAELRIGLNGVVGICEYELGVMGVNG